MTCELRTLLIVTACFATGLVGCGKRETPAPVLVPQKAEPVAKPAAAPNTNPHNLFLLEPAVSGLRVEINGAVDSKAGVDRIVWNWGDDTPETQSWFPAKHLYEKLGIYDVRVTSHDEAGKISTRTTTVKIPSGTVKVELRVSDPTAVLSIDGDEYTPGDLTQPVSLPVGEHTAILRLGGRELRPRTIRVASGKRTILQLAEPNREAAEWVLRIGGRVRIAAGGQEQDATELPDTPFTVTQIDVSNKTVNNADLEQLEGLTGLVYLGLRQTAVTDEGLAIVRGLPELEEVSLEGTKVTNAGLAHLKRLGPHNLILSMTNVSDAGLAHLQGMDLRVLVVNNTRVTDAGFEHLKGMVNMTTLWADDTEMTDKGLAYLHGMPNLNSICLRNTKVTGSGVSGLKSEIHEIWLSGTQLTDADLQQMKNLNVQGRLGLERTKISDAGLEHLQGLTGIWGLNLDNTQISDIGLGYLKELKNLRIITLHGTKVTDAGVADFKAALPECDVQR